MMTNHELEAIRERADEATEGPWYAWDRRVGFHIAIEDPALLDRPPRLIPEGFRTDIDCREDAEFIAHARTDVPALCDEIRRLHSWDGLMWLLDQYWPEDLIPTTLEDRDDRDPGPRIVSLLRWVDRLHAELDQVKDRLDEMVDWAEGGGPR